MIYRNEKFISFETAKLANQKGFDYPCVYYYSIRGTFSGDLVKGYRDLLYKEIYAPTQSLIQKWLRDNFGFHVEVRLANQEYKQSYYFGVFKYNGQFREQLVHTNIRYDSYENALEAGIFVTLNNLK